MTHPKLQGKHWEPDMKNPILHRVTHLFYYSFDPEMHVKHFENVSHVRHDGEQAIQSEFNVRKVFDAQAHFPSIVLIKLVRQLIQVPFEAQTWQ